MVVFDLHLLATCTAKITKPNITNPYQDILGNYMDGLKSILFNLLLDFRFCTFFF